jgi:predicted DNA-binding antitoxin AbrB/MazE fold protein
MVTTIEATYDGTVFRPAEPIEIEPNTRVRITVEAPIPSTEEMASFLDTAASLNLEGPPDWSANLHKYLYGEGADREG